MLERNFTVGKAKQIGALVNFRIYVERFLITFICIIPTQ